MDNEVNVSKEEKESIIGVSENRVETVFDESKSVSDKPKLYENEEESIEFKASSKKSGNFSSKDASSKKVDRYYVLKKIILLVIVTYFFLLSIKLMGGSFKLFGREFAEQLISYTANPIVGLFIGILATSLVQSSSVTTSVIVGLTASGALTVAGAVPMIKGANIGTSITNTIVSLGHITKKSEFKRALQVATVHDFFNFIVVLVLFPLEMLFHPLEKMASYFTTLILGANVGLTFSSPLDYIVKPVAKWIQHGLGDNAIVVLLISIVMIYTSLRYFVKIIKPLAETEFKTLLQDHFFRTPLMSFFVGLFLTIVVQSSSVSTSLAVPIAGVGLVGLTRLYPYILGANVGTTFTALLASVVTGSPLAVTVALEHFFFNCIGSAMMYPLRAIPLRMSVWLSDMAMKSRFVPFVYIGVVFYALPSFVIFVLH